MAVPSWSDLVSVVAVQKVTNGNSARGTLDISGCFGAYIFLRLARLSTTAPGTGCYMRIRRILRDTGNSRDVPHPGSLFYSQDGTGASNLTTLSASPSHPAAAVTLSSATGFAAAQTICIVDSTSSPTRAEWHTTSKLASTTLTFDRNMANTSIASGDTITNAGLVLPPIWVDGTPNAQDIEVVFDYGAEANTSPIVVEAYAQKLTGIS